MRINSKDVVRAILVGLVLALVAPIWPSAASAATSKPRHIVICVDGVGLSTIQELRAEGRFQRFRSPSRMLAPFPSLTNVAMTEVLRPAGVQVSPGYEDVFFDTSANRTRGGLIDRFRGDRFVEGTWRESFDYHPSAIKSGLGYALPPLSTFVEAFSDVARLRQKAAGSTEPVFFGYIGGSDSLAHLGGKAMLKAMLRRLDSAIERIALDEGADLRVSVFSDHGNHFAKYKRVSLDVPLERAGLRIAKKIRGPADCVVPQYGLVGCAVIYAASEAESKVAFAVSRERGVDFAAFERGGVVRLVSSRGNAVVERRGDSYRYTPQAGDPLGLSDVMAELSDEADADGFIPDAAWFEATKNSARPDALRRVFDSVTGHVEHRASVVVSLADGWTAGSAALDFFAAMKATHGSLSLEQSSGFAMTTSGEMAQVIRASDLWLALGSPDLSLNHPLVSS